MATLISELAGVCAAMPGHAVQLQAADMLVTLALPGGRQQTVKVQSRQDNGIVMLRLQSRAGLLTRPSVVLDALRRNTSITRAGFAMDASVRPPALDVVCSLPANPQELPVNDFLHALHEVAVLADHVEQSLSKGGDQF
jgi:hypothetical protein